VATALTGVPAELVYVAQDTAPPGMRGTPLAVVTVVPAPRNAVEVLAVSEVTVTTDGPGGWVKIVVATVPTTAWPVSSPKTAS
jgi:hypothetical protein